VLAKEGVRSAVQERHLGHVASPNGMSPLTF
jgi:hypothetical protein